MNLYTNNATTALAAGLSNVATSLTVTTGGGSLFPVITAGNVFNVTVISGSTGVLEIVQVTARAGDVFTIVRAQGGTSAGTFITGDKVELRITAGNATLWENKVAATSNTGSAALPAGTTGQRDGSPLAGYLRYNTSLTNFEGYNGTSWGALATGFAASGSNSDITSMSALTSINILSGYLFGCVLSTAGSSTTMSFTAGKAQDSTGVQLMSLAAIAKTTTIWTLGTAGGGLDTGVIANNTWYHFFVIRRPDTGVVDVVFSLSAAAPTLPTNYTQFRRIGSGRTNGAAQWTSFRQYGDEFDWSTPVLDVNISAVSASTLTTLTVPTGVKTQPKLQVSVGCSGASPGTGIYAVVGNADDSTSAVEVVSTMNSSNNSQATAQASGFTTDTSARLYFGLVNGGVPSLATAPSGGAASPACIVRTRGWTDTRGRYA